MGSNDYFVKIGTKLLKIIFFNKNIKTGDTEI